MSKEPVVLKQNLIISNKIASVDCVEAEMKWLINNKRMQQTNTKEVQDLPDWVGKLIHWKLCKRVKFDHTTKGLMHKSESVLENQTHKILQDFEVRTNDLAPTGRSDLELIYKKKKLCYLVDFIFSVDHRFAIKESEKVKKLRDQTRALKKPVAHEDECEISFSWIPGV